jgi:hypothetical protein
MSRASSAASPSSVIFRIGFSANFRDERRRSAFPDIDLSMLDGDPETHIDLGSPE